MHSLDRIITISLFQHDSDSSYTFYEELQQLGEPKELQYEPYDPLAALDLDSELRQDLRLLESPQPYQPALSPGPATARGYNVYNVNVSRFPPPSFYTGQGL
jgi:hypothetical protein